MTTGALTVSGSDTVGTALGLLLEHRLLGLPVVDAAGHYQGMFLRSRLVALVLPTIVQLEQKMPELARLLEVGFMADTVDDARERFAKVAGDPVSKYLDTDTPILGPDTPVMSAVLFLYRTRTYLPVVDPATKKLLGVVSTWDVLAKFAVVS